MTGFSMIQRLGSHQNVFTSRNMEGMDMYGLRSKLLSMDVFPNGYYYHHNRPYMREFLILKTVDPYNFHMCWYYDSTNLISIKIFILIFIFFCWGEMFQKIDECKCRTQGKKDKLSYFKKTKMWYLNDQTCSLDQLKPRKGEWPMRASLQNSKKNKLKSLPGLEYLVSNESWPSLAKLCCNRIAGAP